MNAQLPTVAFSPWTSWDDRGSIVGIRNPGVYLLAHFGSSPPTKVDPLAKEIIYIGETGRPLHRRWQEFNSSAFGRVSRHSGGDTYNEVFGSRKGDQLYVACLPVLGLDKEITLPFVRYVERKLLLDYALKWKRVPICNSE